MHKNPLWLTFLGIFFLIASWYTIDAIQKDYPFKACLYASVLWGLLLYFLWIGRRVAKGF